MSEISIPRLAVSGLRGGSGKTILALSLITALKKKNIPVTPFKKGPDYIDAGWLAKASGTHCYNLDLFMMTPDQVMQSFINHISADSLAVVEGNRGLYDGVDHQGSFSTAELAKLLKIPVIVIVDCTKATTTLAALILGCLKMDTAVKIGGVVLNRVATARQESVITKSISHRCGVPVLGSLPRLKKDPFPERHMGLMPFQEHADVEESLETIAEMGAAHIDLDGIVKVANSAEALETGGRGQGGESAHGAQQKTTDGLRIGIIRDSAFQFYYQENIEQLVQRGAGIVEVSPLKEGLLPAIDALYIGGGFPETHAIVLAENRDFRRSLLDAIESGLPVYAECGGLMYLGRSLILQGRTYPMVNAFPITFSLENRPRAHGYTVIEVERENPYFPVGTVIKGHEFHYSTVREIGRNAGTMVFRVKRGKGIIDNMDGICYKNVLAAYTHLHAIGSPEWADGMVNAAVKFRNQK